MIRSNQSIKSSVLKRGAFLSEYVAFGSGAPTVVFEAGLGDDLRVWRATIDELKNITGIFAYNRAGYGRSSSMQKDRDGFVIVEELHSLLQASGHTPPYLLVGHSLGGAFMELFAQKHPEEVCGLVLVDPMAVEMDELCKKDDIMEWGRIPLFRKILTSVFLSRGAKQELRMREKTLSQTRISPPCANPFPVALISAGKSMWSSRLQDAWLNSHALLAKRYSDCSHVVEKESGHHIQMDNPAFVAAQILSLSKAVSINNAGKSFVHQNQCHDL
jgi:pimeloyl-ACP methyl ester carboxylesterase